MPMHEKNGEAGPLEPRDPQRPRTKKVYEKPRLQDWGSITDLTQGLKLGFEDFPVTKGGTRVT